MRIQVLTPSGHLDDIAIKQIEHQLAAVGVTNDTSEVSLRADGRVPERWWLVIDGELAPPAPKPAIQFDPA